MDKTLSKTVSVSSVAVYSTQIKQISKPDQTLTVKIIRCVCNILLSEKKHLHTEKYAETSVDSNKSSSNFKQRSAILLNCQEVGKKHGLWRT